MYNEKDLILHAKKYIDKLSDGINPLNDLPVCESDVVMEERIKICFTYISKWLYKLYFDACVEKVYSTPLIGDSYNPKNQKKPNRTQPAPYNPYNENHTTKKSCDNCKHHRNGSCGAMKLCEEYECAPTISPETMATWPKEGSATHIKRIGKRRRQMFKLNLSKNTLF